MAPATLRSRFVLGASAAAIIGTAALAQTPPPAPAPAAPAASAYPPTATITTPGYPGVGAGRFQASRRRFAQRQKGASAPGHARNHAMGLVRQRPSAGAARQVRRHHRVGNDDAQPQSGGSGHDDRTDQEDAYGFSRPRAAHADRTDLYRGSAAGRRAQGEAQQDRSALLRDELQRAGNVRPVPGRLSGRPGQISVSRPRQA